jgi:hypothetical protein
MSRVSEVRGVIGRNRRFRHATSRLRPLPSFLIIGTKPAGTFSLFHALSQHRDVGKPSALHEGISWAQELHFFDRRFSLGIAWYRSCFPLKLPRLSRGEGRELAFGEATATYLLHPDVPARVAATLPDVALIALLRNPIDRAYWHYEGMRRKGLEPLDFDEALEAEEERTATEEERLAAGRSHGPYRQYAYAGRGLYAEQLERWFAVFRREQFLILRAEDYAADPATVYSEALSFLGLAPWKPPRFQEAKWMEPAPIGTERREQLEERFSAPNARLARLLGGNFVWRQTETMSSAGSGT